MNTFSAFKRFTSFLVLILLTFFTFACSATANLVGQDLPESITICHASGDADHPYTELTLALDELPAHSKDPDDIIPAPADGCPTELVPDANDGKITICHATSSAVNPYNKITIALSGLSGHGKHEQDLILQSDTEDCPNGTQTPTLTLTPDGTLTVTPTITPTPTVTLTPQVTDTTSGDGEKITICHATGSKKNRYVMITISVNGLNGHEKHDGDIIPAPAGGCPE